MSDLDKAIAEIEERLKTLRQEKQAAIDKARDEGLPAAKERLKAISVEVSNLVIEAKRLCDEYKLTFSFIIEGNALYYSHNYGWDGNLNDWDSSSC